MIHKFYSGGFYIVMDIGSCAVHVVDKLTYLLLDEINEQMLKDNQTPEFSNIITSEFSSQDINNAVKELKSLYDAQLLYTDDSYQEFKELTGIAPVKAMCLNVAHDCNLRCKYCFASTGSFCGVRKMMDFDTAKKAIDLLIKLSKNRRNLEVDFFGGEPLMNFEVVKQTVEYARSIEKQYNKNFRFTITTNGLLLDEAKQDYINKEMQNCVLSLDGRKNINDNLRKCVNGDGCYDIITPNYQSFVQKRGDKEYYVRGTYTKHNLDFDKDVLHLYDLGFDQISVEPVTGPDEDEYAITEKNLEEIEKSYTRLMDTMIERKKTGKDNFNFFHFMLDLEQGPCAIKRIRGCGAGNEYVAVTPDGEIYPCHQFVGNQDYLMGSVEQGIQNKELNNKFANANLLNKPECNKCWAKFYCSGGCNANNFNMNKDMLVPHKLSCELEKIRLECSIAIKAALAK